MVGENSKLSPHSHHCSIFLGEGNGQPADSSLVACTTLLSAVTVKIVSQPTYLKGCPFERWEKQ